MPRLPVASGRQVVAALQSLGFTQVRQRGSHVVTRRGDVGCVVPMHGQMKEGTSAQIIRQPGLAPEELLAFL